MTDPSQHEIIQLLRAWGAGDPAALEKLMPLVYAELHGVAQRYMGREAPDHTLQTTALVHEAYMRLVDVKQVTWQDRAHFFAVCAKLMRRILTDFARSRRSLKRAGYAHRVSLDNGLTVPQDVSAELIAVDEALNALAAVDPRKSQVVELRFFGGLSVEETAKTLKISPETVLRDWKVAKVWLFRELSAEKRHGA